VGSRVRNIFFVIIFLELLVVISIFCLVIALIFAMNPGSVLPVWAQIPIAVALGYVVYRRGGGLVLSTAVAVALMYGTMFAGEALPLSIPQRLVEASGMPATGIWAVALLAYAFVASILPVTTLLQPRDYINAWQLFIAMGLITLGALSAGLFHGMDVVAPAFNLHPEGAPPLAPVLFITIACGAISGFHSLVSSGTTAKQLEKESDALPVGYGSMLLESALAGLVLVAVAAGIGMGYKGESGVAAWNAHYGSWQAAAGGLGAKLRAFVAGSANMIETIGVPRNVARIIIGVFVASFAGTTLDTATRLQRYIVAEFFKNIGAKAMSGKYAATFVAVGTAGVLTFVSGADGKGALKLWPMFGAVNQLLAALGLLVVSVYLKRKGGWRHLVTSIPCAFMLAMTLWAVALNELGFIEKGNYFLAVVNGATGAMAVWMAVESVAAFFSKPDAGASGASAAEPK
jgi:carbon starvation protein